MACRTRACNRMRIRCTNGMVGRHYLRISRAGADTTAAQCQPGSGTGTVRSAATPNSCGATTPVRDPDDGLHPP
ncbi:hypothetical protein NUM_42920 [Actinocatenispora comari]|uniref:Uncharacterized protein n=1 Tax=Actinocatenispora comari TaxID=2807577 RepID=A0A8J4ADG9_9ACTN|nr:hypothetical protein NUM_42920 [Actinocatenispora comari]